MLSHICNFLQGSAKIAKVRTIPANFPRQFIYGFDFINVQFFIRNTHNPGFNSLPGHISAGKDSAVCHIGIQIFDVHGFRNARHRLLGSVNLRSTAQQEISGIKHCLQFIDILHFYISFHLTLSSKGFFQIQLIFFHSLNSRFQPSYDIRKRKSRHLFFIFHLLRNIGDMNKTGFNDRTTFFFGK